MDREEAESRMSGLLLRDAGVNVSSVRVFLEIAKAGNDRAIPVEVLERYLADLQTNSTPRDFDNLKAILQEHGVESPSGLTGIAE